jgi:hypothetical protein
MKKYLLLISVSFIYFVAQAQLSVTDSLSNSQITTLLQGSGLTISNLVVNCPGKSIGQFSGTSEMPITQGLVLSSGLVDSVAGSASLFTTYTNNMSGDPDLQALTSPWVTYDACVLEFDCIPTGDTLLFNFSFGSEEYPEYVNASFNDVFAIFLSGPGITGTINTAALPNGTPVSIDNVNALTNSSYFYDNQNPIGQFCSYDGFTTNLTAFAEVIPSNTYHFKVAIADVGDTQFDSGVFLEAFSFRSVLAVSTSIAEIKDQNKLEVFPNPAAEFLQLNYQLGLSSNVGVDIYDVAGRLVYSESYGTQAAGSYSNSIALNKMNAGSYTLILNTVQGNSFHKLIIQ